MKNAIRSNTRLLGGLWQGIVEGFVRRTNFPWEGAEHLGKPNGCQMRSNPEHFCTC